MAGTPHPIDRHRVAELLGFASPLDNAMDSVSARDHVIESVSACAILASHLSRLAEELVIWSTNEFGLVKLSDSWSTGSSIMPQKRNPDAAEIIRGKTGRVYGALITLLTMVKSLPLAYNRDLQEDRPALFDGIHTSLACVRVMTGAISSLSIKSGPDLAGDPLLATELADFLASKGVPFRDAHRVVGQIVKLCEDSDRGLDELSLNELQQAHSAFTPEVFAWLEPEAAAERRTSFGGTAWCEVERQVKLLKSTV